MSSNSNNALDDRRGKEKLSQKEYELKIQKEERSVKPSKSDKIVNIGKGLKKALDKM